MCHFQEDTDNVNFKTAYFYVIYTDMLLLRVDYKNRKMCSLMMKIPKCNGV